MRWYVNYMSLATAFALLIVLLLQRECHHCPECPGQDTATRVVYRVDTVTITRNIYHQAPKPMTVILYDTVYPDTALALKDYSTLKIYERLLMDDSTGRIRLTDSVQYNALKGSRLTANIHQKHTTEIITHTIVQQEPARAKLFVGLVVGSGLSLQPSFSGQAGLVTGKERMYMIGYDPFNGVIGVGVMWGIHFRK